MGREGPGDLVTTEPGAHDGHCLHPGAPQPRAHMSHTRGVRALGQHVCRQHRVCVPTGQALTELRAQPRSWGRWVQGTDGTRVRALHSPAAGGLCVWLSPDSQRSQERSDPNCPCLEGVDVKRKGQRPPAPNRPRGQASTVGPEQGSDRDTGTEPAGQDTRHALGSPHQGHQDSVRAMRMCCRPRARQVTLGRRRWPQTVSAPKGKDQVGSRARKGPEGGVWSPGHLAEHGGGVGVSSHLADPGQLVLQVLDGAVLRFQNVLRKGRCQDVHTGSG